MIITDAILAGSKPIVCLMILGDRFPVNKFSMETSHYEGLHVCQFMFPFVCCDIKGRNNIGKLPKGYRLHMSY